MANEKRLIDANALSKSIKEGSGTELQKFFADICVATAHTVDAVEVVRCANCAVPHNKWTGCPKLSGLVPPPDFYCAFGERKDNG